MEQGQFYFITDKFYSIHDKERKLMLNKEHIDGAEHSRPCFYAFRDNKTPGIYWCIPISSKIEKYKVVYENKLRRQQEKSILNPKCDTIYFGNVMGFARVFLIQNMFPVTDKYIASTYIDKNTNKPVTIEPEIERQVVNRARNILRLVYRGYNNLVFSDIINIYKDLCVELKNEK